MCIFEVSCAAAHNSAHQNPSKTTREEIEAIFKAGGITAKNMWADPRAYALEGAENIPAMEAYWAGKISLQGLASMVAANQAALNGGIILDVCAAPGGKILQQQQSNALKPRCMLLIYIHIVWRSSFGARQSGWAAT